MRLTAITLAEAVAGLKLVLGTTARPRAAEGQKVYTLREAAQALPAEGVGVVFGPEDFGLSNDDLAHCQGYIQIPTAAYASLNLAQAVGVVAYEWFTTHAETTQALRLNRPCPQGRVGALLRAALRDPAPHRLHRRGARKRAPTASSAACSTARGSRAARCWPCAACAARSCGP